MKVIVPSVVQGSTSAPRTRLDVSGASTVCEVLERLEHEVPGIRERILEPDGRVRRFLNLFLNGEDVRFLSGLATPVDTNDELVILPAVAGGSR